MTTICGFKRRGQVVLAWDTRTTEYGKICDLTYCKGEMFYLAGSFWSVASSGSTSLGRRVQKILKENLGEKSMPEITDLLIDHLKEVVSWKHEPGDAKSQRCSSLFTDEKRLFEIDEDLFIHEVNTSFKGSGGELARGAYEALKNTKITNMALLKCIYAIVSSIDCYTGPEFVTNLT